MRKQHIDEAGANQTCGAAEHQSLAFEFLPRKRECGNCRNLDVALARRCCGYYAALIAGWNEAKLAYPTAE